MAHSESLMLGKCIAISMMFEKPARVCQVVQVVTSHTGVVTLYCIDLYDGTHTSVEWTNSWKVLPAHPESVYWTDVKN